MREGRPGEALKNAVLYIGRANHTEQQVFDFLQRKGYTPEEAAEAVATLLQKGYLDDEDHAARYVQTHPQYSKAILRMKLRQMGISDARIAAALEAVTDDDEVEGAKRIILKRNVDYEDRDDVRRALQAAARHGFSYSVAKRALDEAQAEEEEENEDE